MSAPGRAWVKTQERPLEIISRLGEFSVEVSCLITGRYRLVSQSIASHVVFEGNFWGETGLELSHNLGRWLSVLFAISVKLERPLSEKAVIIIDR